MYYMTGRSFFTVHITCNIAVVGHMLAGKSLLIFIILKHCEQMFASNDRHQEIIYCYSVYQSLYSEMERVIPNLTLHGGLPTPVEILQFVDDQKGTIMVLHDLAVHVVQSVMQC